MSSLRLTRRILSASKLGNDPSLKKLENKLIIYYDFEQKKLDKNLSNWLPSKTISFENSYLS